MQREVVDVWPEAADVLSGYMPSAERVANGKALSQTEQPA